MSLPETPKSKKIKDALLRLRSSAIKPFVYTQFASVLLNHLETKDEGVIDRYLDRFLTDVNSEEFNRLLKRSDQKTARIHLVLDTLDRNIDGALPPIDVQGRQPDYRAGVNIHGRDHLTLNAYNVLSEKLGEDDWKNHANAFLTYLTEESHKEKANAIESEKCREAIKVLTQRLYSSFPGLMDEESPVFILHDQQINGFDAIGKFWKFCNSIEDAGDKKLAILSMIESILQFMNDYNTRVCQPGQLQRLMVGVVQGRLPGVNIDGVDFLTKINGDLALDLFLKDQKRKDIDDANMMSDVARIFIKENDNIDIDDFIEKLKSYWGLQGYDGELSLDKN